MRNKFWLFGQHITMSHILEYHQRERERHTNTPTHADVFARAKIPHEFILSIRAWPWFLVDDGYLRPITCRAYTHFVQKSRYKAAWEKNSHMLHGGQPMAHTLVIRSRGLPPIRHKRKDVENCKYAQWIPNVYEIRIIYAVCSWYVA